MCKGLKTIRINCVGCTVILLFALTYMYQGGIGPSVLKTTNIGPKINNGDTHVSEFRRKPYDVLLIGYFRGGTTFTGELLGFRNESFYVYEPLDLLGRFGYFTQGLHCSVLNETCSKNDQTDNEILDIIRGIFTCDSRKYQHLLSPWQVYKSMGETQRKKMIKKCTKQNSIICLKKFVNRCSTNLSIVSKVPRVSIGLASKLLAELPYLKIVYLLRDPRAVMNSRYKLKWDMTVSGGARSLCKKMITDYQESIKTKREYTGRLHTIFYENLAQNPEETLREIYNFVGFRYTAKDKLFLTSRTTSLSQGGPSSTYRHNSTKTAWSWRHNIPTNVLKEINKACSSAYKLLGYPQLATAFDLKNEKMPLKLVQQNNS